MNKATPVPKPVDLILEFSDEPPNITVFCPPTNLSPVKSTVPVKKYVTSSANVITFDTAVGKSSLSETNTNSPFAIVTSPPTAFKKSKKSTLLGTSLPTTSKITPSVSLIDALSIYLCVKLNLLIYFLRSL